MPFPDSLPDLLAQTRITYEETRAGVTINGAPVTVDFETAVEPEQVAETITTPDSPWWCWGVKSQLSGEYWKVTGQLLHYAESAQVSNTDDESGDGRVTDVSPITLEIAPEWARVYIKADCDVDRVVSFFEVLDAEYGITVTVADSESGETTTVGQ